MGKALQFLFFKVELSITKVLKKKYGIIFFSYRFPKYALGEIYFLGNKY